MCFSVLAGRVQGAFNYKAKTYKLKPIREEKISYKKSVAKVMETFADENCESRGYFMNCYNWSLAECKKYSSESFKYCQTQSLTKRHFANVEEALIHFSQVGRCAGEKIENRAAAYKKTDVDCQEVARWL